MANVIKQTVENVLDSLTHFVTSLKWLKVGGKCFLKCLKYVLNSGQIIPMIENNFVLFSMVNNYFW